MNSREVQAALLSLGYDPGPIDGIAGAKTKAAVRAFQSSHRLHVDGVVGPRTIAALQAALQVGRADQPSRVGAFPTDWLPAARMSRVIVHWTAGSHRASGLDRSHYHILIEGDGKLVRGIPSIALNDAGGTKKGYAAHTLNCNTGSIGVALCCMAGAIETPFKPGSAPMTRTQWEALPPVLAELCWRYEIVVTPRTVLSHAEVLSNLGIAQRGKWDIARLAFDPSIIGARACGDLFRKASLRINES